MERLPRVEILGQPQDDVVHGNRKSIFVANKYKVSIWETGR